MDWLQNLDVTLFRYINQTWGNPVFDVVMPFLSGNIFFAPAIILTAFWLVWKDRLRGGLCVLMLALIVWPGDGFITLTIRKAIGRPRPYVVMPETIRRPQRVVVPSETQLLGSKPGKVGMPSSHAANWGAGTMILFIYFRRSLWIALPLGLAVCYSRVYKGVHYPGDVLAGFLLGATYAAILTFAFDALWRKLGRRIFPRWHERVPSLIPPGAATVQAR